MLRLFKHANIIAILILFSLFFGMKVTAHASFYDQASFSEQELLRFIEVLPSYREWARAEREFAHPSLDAQGKASFVYSKKVERKLQELNWSPQRFFILMGRSAAALAIIENPELAQDKRPAEMPQVRPEEMELIKKHKNALIKAAELHDKVKSTKEKPRLPARPRDKGTENKNNK